MSTRSVKFRVESNKAKSSFWYTLVAGNGDTVMTSKASYSAKAKAKRAAKRMIETLLSSQLVLEYEDKDGQWYQEEAEPVTASLSASVRASQKKADPPPVSFVPAAESLNPNA